MGQTHLRALEGSTDVTVVAVAEPVVALREHVEGAFGVQGYSSLDEMLDAGGIDGALIVTPSDSHVDVIAKVAQAGLPMLCEKPCGVAPEDTRRARTLVETAGVALQIAYWRRFVPELQQIRDRIVSGDFGEVLSVSCLQWDGEPPATAFRARSGGIFVDMGVHEFDQLRWLTGQDITAIHACAATISEEPNVPGDAESAHVLCDLSGGSTGLVSLGRRLPQGDVCWAHIFGTRDAEECRFLWPPDAEAAFLQALRLQAESFARGADGTETDAARAEDAIAALTAAETASQALR